MYFFEGSSQVYWYGIHLTPDLAGGQIYATAGSFRARRLRRLPALDKSLERPTLHPSAAVGPLSVRIVWSFTRWVAKNGKTWLVKI
ncbi:MAG: hypothetical protein F4148_16305 [Caldilineaceae bacterium SB0675_bin_29]|uniref:Uncharacterized protein n=1 Tax=Caldilineaceae bacterium SB0675_bin_29 TaxID=2605266 RepID=A0A6B1G1B3_9CHLR|nr:hypothetical protein [Caldilineaceae bacterium SB0675_bin_29]